MRWNPFKRKKEMNFRTPLIVALVVIAIGMATYGFSVQQVLESATAQLDGLRARVVQLEARSERLGADATYLGTTVESFDAWQKRVERSIDELREHTDYYYDAIPFDWRTAEIGDTYGEWTLVSLDLGPSYEGMMPSERNFAARFEGEVEVSGAYRTEAQDAMFPGRVFFFPDRASCARLPGLVAEDGRHLGCPSIFSPGTKDGIGATLSGNGDASVELSAITVVHGEGTEAYHAAQVSRVIEVAPESE